MVKGAPKCKICKTNHFGVCGVGDARGIATAPTNEFEITLGIIRRGKRTFIEVGEALLKMHDKKLYKSGGFATFASFCESEGLTRGYAYQVMEGTRAVAKVSDNLTSVGAAQAREIAKVVKTEGVEVANEVMEKVGPKPTAAKIRKAVQARSQPELTETYAIEQPCPHPSTTCDNCGEKIQRV